MTTFGDMVKQFGGAPVNSADILPAEVHLVGRSGDYEPHKFWRTRWKKGKYHTTLSSALSGSDAVTSGRNDVIYLTPDEHEQTAASTSAAAITWSQSNTHLIGTGGYLPGYNASAVNDDGAAGTGHYNPLLDVTGSYNSFRNIRFTVGNATNTNLNSIRVQGNGNLFENCFFRGPMSTTLADINAYCLVKVGGIGNVFRNCIFGTMWKTRDGGKTSSSTNCLLRLGRAADGTAARHTIFENCIFQSNVDHTGVIHIDVNSGGDVGYGPQYFKNCHLHFRWSDQADQVTQAIYWGTGGMVATLHFDANCSVWGADDIIVGPGRSGVIWAQSGETTDTLGLALNTA